MGMNDWTRVFALYSSIPQNLVTSSKSNILLSSKSFDPKTFLSTVHPNATFKDLGIGRERIKES
jgi:exocyst complex component 2